MNAKTFDADNITTEDLIRLRVAAVAKEDHIAIAICDEARQGMEQAQPGFRSWPTLTAMRHAARLLNDR